MRMKNLHEKGSLMVEVMAVIALLGVMGTMLFRQVQRRNEELDNINMASEIRIVKEATAAYIQANKATLEANNCPAIGDDNVDVSDLPLGAVEKFMPDNWISDEGTSNGIIHEYQIYLSCYRVNSPSADNRLAMYGTVVPNAPGHGNSPLPPNFTLRRAARVATLIGADGGVFEDGKFVGAMGAWEIDCEGDGSCDDREDNFYVATTGMDIYVPETDKTADNTVAVPHNIAFGQLHATDYFSVGDGDIDCVSNATLDENDKYKFAHEDLVEIPGRVAHAADDVIRNPGDGACDPLFWVGADSNRHNVYVKNNLYVGQNASNHRRAISLETGGGDSENAITVHDSIGGAILTLNGAGQIIGRVDSTGKGYKLDAANGEIILFEEATATVDGQNHTVQIPIMRLKDGRMETNVAAQYYDDDGTLTTDVYAVDPAGESLMNDIRLTSRGGARLSDILPDYILKNVQSITATSTVAGDRPTVPVPDCPRGYIPAISVTPIKYIQFITDVDLNLNLTTNGADGSAGHTHAITGQLNNSVLTQNKTTTNLIRSHIITTTGTGSDGVNNSSLTITQLPPVRIIINQVLNPQRWRIGLAYGTGAQPYLEDNPITALAQTYCVFDRDTFMQDTDVEYVSGSGMRFEAKSRGVISNRVCTSETEGTVCDNTEKCVSGYCRKLGTCSDPDNTPLGSHVYCLKRTQVYIECFSASDCGEGKTCTNSRCVATGSGS